MTKEEFIQQLKDNGFFSHYVGRTGAYGIYFRWKGGRVGVYHTIFDHDTDRTPVLVYMSG